MTVSYTRSLATFRYASLVRLLLRWRGSVYKAVWRAVLAYILMYTFVAVIYHVLPARTIEEVKTKKRFIQVCAYVGHTSNAIPLSFVLGFFVNMVISRWWQQFLNLPTPDAVCMLMSTYLRRPPKVDIYGDLDSQLDRPSLFRRTITRYLNLSSALCFYGISLSLRRHVSSLDDFVECGLMTKQEQEIYRDLCHENEHFFIPLVWAITLLTRAHHEGMIYHERHLDSMVTAVVNYWRMLQNLFLYDYVNVPLVYNQVVTLVVYVYLGTAVLSQQFSDPVTLLKEVEHGLNRAVNETLLIEELGNVSQTNNITELAAKNLELLGETLNVVPNVPIFAILSIIFYMGWLRVAETNVFPFGDDDDDFEVIPLLERNLSAGVWFVDAALNSEAEILNLVNQQKTVEYPLGSQGDTESEIPSKLISEAIKHEAMGWKRTPSTIPEEKEPSTGPTVVLTPPHEPESVIPDLPCPPDLRRRTSKYFFAGSINRLQEEEEAAEESSDRQSRRSVAASDESLAPPRSLSALNAVGVLVGRVGRRISEVFGGPADHRDLPPRHASVSSLRNEDHEGLPKRD